MSGEIRLNAVPKVEENAGKFAEFVNLERDFIRSKVIYRMLATQIYTLFIYFYFILENQTLHF